MILALLLLQAGPKAADGWIVERAAEASFPMFATLDDQGRLYVAESSGLDLYAEISAGTRKCRIALYERRNGRLERAGVFADGLVFPMGLAWRQGMLYVADPPDLVVYEGSKRRVILSGFGHRDNGSLHGLGFGPDGLLYMTMGDPDGYRLAPGVEGKTGALLRCRPDGSGVEVLASGFENLVEVAFLPGGEIIGTDNWFRRLVGGTRDAIVHLVPGGLYPLHADKPSPLPVLGDPLPPVSLFPAVALSGLTYVHGKLYSAQHNARRVMSHTLASSGSTFTSHDEELVTSDDPDFHPSDVLEDIDGSLLVVDTGSWYVHHCPTGRIRRSPAQGGIYRVRDPRQPACLDPLGLREDWPAASPERLVHLMSDLRPLVRDRARRELIRRGESVAAASSMDSIWALAEMPGAEATLALERAMEDPRIAPAAARILGLRDHRAAEAGLIRLLGSGAPPARLAAAEALARCGGPLSAQPLLSALAGDLDRVEEHALIYALYRTAEDQNLRDALQNPHPRVQRAALQALSARSKLDPQDAFQRIGGADPELRRTALAVLQRHPGWGAEAASLLRGWFAKGVLSEEERRALSTTIVAFQNDPSVQELVAGHMSSVALEAVSRTGLAKLPKSWVEALGKALERVDLVQDAVRAAAVFQVGTLDAKLSEIAEDAARPPSLRVEALRAIVAKRPELSPRAFELLLSRLALREDPVARLAAAEVLARSRLDDREALRALAVSRRDPLVNPGLILGALGRASPGSRLPDEVAEMIKGGWSPSEQELSRVLDLYPDRARELRALVKRDDAGKIARFEPLLAGGDPERGRRIFWGKATCSTCHRIGSDGGQVGPDLTKIGAVRSGRDILESVLLPSASIAQGFESYVVETAEGRVFTGILASQSEERIVLKDSGGAETSLGRDRIARMKRSSVSLMPEGLERPLSDMEFRDLMAFLLSLR